MPPLGDASDSEEEERFNAMFWRQPIGPPPDLEDASTVRNAGKDEDLATQQLKEPKAQTEEEEKEPEPQPPPLHSVQQQQQQQRPTADQIRKLNEKLVPQLVLPATTDMSMEDIKAELLELQAAWFRQHCRPVKPSDAPALPQRVCQLYDELGRRLTPEQVAIDQAKAKARQSAEAELDSKRQAEAAEVAARRKAAEEARAKEWEEFEQNREAAWKAAKGEAEDQREEVAEGEGVSAIALTGASTFVKIDQGERDTRPTREQYIEQCKADFGLL